MTFNYFTQFLQNSVNADYEHLKVEITSTCLPCALITITALCSSLAPPLLCPNLSDPAV